MTWKRDRSWAENGTYLETGWQQVQGWSLRTEGSCKMNQTDKGPEVVTLLLNQAEGCCNSPALCWLRQQQPWPSRQWERPDVTQCPSMKRNKSLCFILSIVHVQTSFCRLQIQLCAEEFMPKPKAAVQYFCTISKTVTVTLRALNKLIDCYWSPWNRVQVENRMGIKCADVVSFTFDIKSVKC